MAKSANDIDRTLAVITLAQIGGREDLSLIMRYITSRNWISNEDCHWLSKVTSRLFTESDFNDLMRRLGHNNYYDQIIVYEALSTLCRKLDEATLLSLLRSDDLNVQRYGVTGLTIKGNWEIINRWWKKDEFRGAIIEGLRYVKDEKAQNMLFELLGDKSDQLRLKAGESLACTRDENVLERVIAQFIKNPYGQEADIMCDVAKHLDRSLYSPIKWERDLERDFTSLRYSVTRDD
jgi:HEAT repeat protein